MSKTNGVEGYIDPQFRGGTLSDGSHKGFEFTYVQATPPVPTVTVFPYYSFSDFGGAPIPTYAKIQGGATYTPTPAGPTPTNTPTFAPGTQPPFLGVDRHVIVVDQPACNLYELYNAFPRGSGNWDATSDAQWALSSNTIRPTLTATGRPSADASGLPMYPLIPQYTEVAGGSINHAIRVTVAIDKVRCTNYSLAVDGTTPCAGNGYSPGYVWPATYSDGWALAATPVALPMGTRLRLRADYTPTPCSPACPQALTFITALKQYGAIIADTDDVGYADMGLHGEWTAAQAPGAGWDNDDIFNLESIPLKEFEVVKTDTGCPGSYAWCPLCDNPCGPN